jgi:hypothetical protein
MLKVQVDEKRNILSIEIPLSAPAPSSTGRTFVVASTRGFVRTDVQFQGKPLSVSVNATVPR